jgi:hypothetical protein
MYLVWKVFELRTFIVNANSDVFDMCLTHNTFALGRPTCPSSEARIPTRRLDLAVNHKSVDNGMTDSTARRKLNMITTSNSLASYQLNLEARTYI